MAVRATRLRRLRIRQAVRAATVLSVLAVSALSYLAISKQITLVVDGRPEAMRTMSANVGDLLEGEGIDLVLGLSVEPPPGTRLADGMAVTVASLAVAEQTSKCGGLGGGRDQRLVVEDRGSVGRGFALRVRCRDRLGGGRSSRRDGEGSRRAQQRGDRGELLSAMGITPDADDRVQPSPSTPLHVGTRVRFTGSGCSRRTWTHGSPSRAGPPPRARSIPARSGSSSPVRTGCCGPPTGSGSSTARSVGRARRTVARARGGHGAAPLAASSMYAGRPTGASALPVGEASWYDPPWAG